MPFVVGDGDRAGLLKRVWLGHVGGLSDGRDRDRGSARIVFAVPPHVSTGIAAVVIHYAEILTDVSKVSPRLTTERAATLNHFGKDGILPKFRPREKGPDRRTNGQSNEEGLQRNAAYCTSALAGGVVVTLTAGEIWVGLLMRPDLPTWIAAEVLDHGTLTGVLK